MAAVLAAALAASALAPGALSASTPGGTAAPDFDEGSPPVNPRHWSYVVLARLVRAGLIATQPAYAFEGTRVFRRDELGRLAGEAAAAARAAPGRLDPALRDALDQLLTEFAAELEAQGLDPGLPPPGTAAPRPLLPELQVDGSLIGRFTRSEGQGNDEFSTRLELEAYAGPLRAGLTTTVDDALRPEFRRQSGDLEFGETWRADLSRRFVEAEGHPRGELLAYGRLGDIIGARFGQELVLGATDLDGFQGLLELSEAFELQGIWGERETGGDIYGLRVAAALPQGWRAGASAATAEGAPEDFHGVGAADLHYEDERLRLRGELARREDAGRGLFAEAELNPMHPGEHLQLFLFHRDYDGFVVDHNNGPIYTGVSGGDDVDERGGGAVVRARPWPALELILRYDASRRPTAPRQLQDSSYELVLEPAEGYELAYAYEQERSRADVIRVQSARAARFGGDGERLALDWNLDDDPQGVLETLRLEYRLPLLERQLVLRLSDGYRLRGAERGHAAQGQADWNLDQDLTLALRYTSAEGEPVEDSVTFTLIGRF